MVNQNKNILKKLPPVERISSGLGVAAMLLATGFAMMEHGASESHKLVQSLQPAYAYAAQPIEGSGQALHIFASSDQSNDEMTLRRAGNKEEIHHASATYGAIKRSNPVSGSF